MPSPSDWPNSYVRALHAAVSTPTEVLARLVQQATDDRIERVERIVDGYENEVYRVETSGGQDVVVRIKRFGGTMDQSVAEGRLIGQARAVGVPAPEVLLLDSLGIEGTEFPVMVQRAVPGRPLAEIYGNLTAEQRHNIVFGVGRLIARLNLVPADTDWAARTGSEVARRRAERGLVIKGGFTAAECDRMITALEGYVERFPCPDPVLCHGDLSPKHIFIDSDLRITGVIDFGDAHGGSPIEDLAILRVRGPALSLASLLAGYGDRATAEFRRRLDLHTLLVALGSLAIGVDESDDACIRRVSPLIRTIAESLVADGHPAVG